MSGHSPRRGFGCLLASAGQYFKPPTRLALVDQMVKCLSAMLETWVHSLGGEDPLEKEVATPPVFLPGEFHGQKRLVGQSPLGPKESDN